MYLPYYGSLVQVAAAAGDPADIDFNTSNNIGSIQTQVEANKHTLSAYPATASRFMRVGSFKFEQFGAGIFDAADDEVFFRTNLDNTRYRARWTGSDQPDSGLISNLGSGVFSAWRGGNPGAPTQTDNIANFTFFFNQFGSKSCSIQIQVEEPDGSSTIVHDRTVSMSLTRTA